MGSLNCRPDCMETNMKCTLNSVKIEKQIGNDCIALNAFQNKWHAYTHFPIVYNPICGSSEITVFKVSNSCNYEHINVA